MSAAVAAAAGVRLGWLLDPWLPGGLTRSSAREVEIRGVAADSRRVRPGCLFAAVAGSRAHGLAYLHEALKRGAAAVVWEPAPAAPAESAAAAARRAGVPLVAMEGLGQLLGPLAARAWGHPSSQLDIVAVTGTDGKTSVTHFIAQLLKALDGPAAVIGTLGYGPPGALTPTSMTTPDAASLQQALAECRDAGCRAVALEASSHALDQHRLAGTEVDVAVLTNVGRDHLDYHGSLEAYAAAKSRLFQVGVAGIGVFNIDDPLGRRWAEAAAGRRVTYSNAGNPADLRAVEVHSAPHGMEIELVVAGDAGHRVRLGLMGRFNVANALAAAGAAIALGHRADAVVAALACLSPVPGRMERFSAPGRPLVVVDYAHTPEALKHALAALRDHCRGRVVAVFGCGGDRDRGKRPLMGRVAEEGAEVVVITDDNPRSEDGAAIAAEITAGMERLRPWVIRDRAEAIAQAVEQAGPDDVVLIAGKGHESEQEIAGARHPFSDREVVAAVLAGVAGEASWSR